MKKNNKKGFTLVELVIVVAVMAVLVAVAIPTVSSITSSAKTAVADTNCRTIESMIKLQLAESVKEGSGAGTASIELIDTALTNAKLGIDGTFYYDSVTGNCSTTASGDFQIVLDADATSADNIAVVTARTK